MSGTRGRCACIIAAYALALFIAGLAQAQSPDPAYLSEYRHYQQAFNSGDEAAAAQHALAAWRAAEEMLGDHETTAVLAYNYGKLVSFVSPGDAGPALQRADELMKAGIAELPADELELLLAYVEFRLSRRGVRDARALRKVMMAREERGIPPTLESARVWLELATDDSTAERFPEAIAAAERAEKAIVAAAPYDYRTRALAIIVRGVGLLVPFPRTVEDVDKAHNEFDRALALFPPQKDIDAFDVVYARAMAWDGAAHSALATLGEDKFPTECEAPCDERRVFEYEVPTDEECGIEWQERKPPSYPGKASRKGFIGSAVVGYRFENDLLVHEARVLAEVPVDAFGSHSLKSMEKWRLVRPASDKPECRKNRLSSFYYVFSD